ncbi:PREDICTED: uncharacterized protein LOC109219662 [Nicotiana attenuata]|uniref:Acyl-coa-binding domain-containing protein 3 n=1 Tax=Nicotiana attenuata TaxID=49451 RepID=A0A1J6JSW8_NICAT|nr:PREDICTED: uncharacterized protein LOC109219662 [Nicotiana attenuata]XP_019239681.1 PREDICTED: uncharacterized protein LOC109219662 [Nicotiana attenuata]OIT20829.1 acyl-coa-binding domain-containing protein 3 [Nicotiana attenuata]
MVFFQELLFTLGLSLLFYVIIVKLHPHSFMQGRYYSWSLQSSVTSRSKNDTSKKSACYIKDLARTNDQKSKELRVKKVVEENPMGDVGTAVLEEKMEKNEQEVSKEEGHTYVKQNVGGDDNGVEEKVSDKSCCVAPKFREFEIGSLYYVEEIPEELEFQEIENNPSEKDGVAKEGAGNLEKQDVSVEEDDKGLLEDWEGIERTDLEKLFDAAVVFVDSKKNDEVLDNELKMKLYGLHKIATEGPCYGPQPMPFKLSARAKWSSWHRLGDMSREKAMEKYVALLSDRVAEWKIDKIDVNYELISRDIETSQDRRRFCAQVSRLR